MMSTNSRFSWRRPLCAVAALLLVTDCATAQDAKPHQYAVITSERVTRALAEDASKADISLAEGSLAALGWYVLYGNDEASSSLARKFNEIVFNAYNGTPRINFLMESQSFGEMLNLGRFEKRKPVSRSPEYTQLTQDRVNKALAEGAGSDDFQLAEGSLTGLGWMTLHGNDSASMELATKLMNVAAKAWPANDEIYMQQTSIAYAEMIHLGRFETIDGAPAQDEPAPATPARFTAEGEDAVLDNETGLVWFRNPSIIPAVNWASAMAPMLENPNGWRIPSNEEWKGMLPSVRSATGHELFSVDWEVRCWSSTTPPSQGTAYHVALWGDGGTDLDGADAMRNVWPVRGGKDTPANTVPQAPEPRQVRFIDQGDETVLDSASGLVWLKNPSAIPAVTWSAAMAYVQEQGGGWRLPTNEEWKTMLPSGLSAVGAELFSVDWELRAWSSTTPPSEGTAYHVSLLGDGGADLDGAGALRQVWPVRAVSEGPR